MQFLFFFGDKVVFFKKSRPRHHSWTCDMRGGGVNQKADNCTKKLCEDDICEGEGVRKYRKVCGPNLWISFALFFSAQIDLFKSGVIETQMTCKKNCG